MSGIQTIRDGLSGNITRVIVIAIIITFIGSVGWAGFFSQGNANVIAKVGSKEITNANLSFELSSQQYALSQRFPDQTIEDELLLNLSTDVLIGKYAVLDFLENNEVRASFFDHWKSIENIYSEILKKNIEDEKGNVNSCLIMGKKIEEPELKKEKKLITSCIFRVKSEPSALYKCLGGFATNQVNLTKLESFSVKNTFDQANFYLDLEGHLDESGVKKAMEELGFHTVTLQILGVYEASTFRQK